MRVQTQPESIITTTRGVGVILSGATNASVSHGLAKTPAANQIHVIFTENPTNTPGATWVDNIGASTFKVNIENAPGASNLDFAWECSVEV